MSIAFFARFRMQFLVFSIQTFWVNLSVVFFIGKVMVNAKRGEPLRKVQFMARLQLLIFWVVPMVQIRTEQAGQKGWLQIEALTAEHVGLNRVCRVFVRSHPGCDHHGQVHCAIHLLSF